ncbi:MULTISPECIES: hypothetical protein [Dickeya]|uniref:Uncharacterized protein n=1 Tax=Dickeya aquatica TaxID=1401087 RepID=A0A375ADB1_9GAMM|nr:MULTISPECIES: hypothetical protein [Dickeya]SLM63987.1 hypothetical protein DAQ1742_03164 [Dickeya aquatica]SLM64515.1 hypothetical protein DAQ1742_03721 [Dickeya aquatica]
MAKVVISITPKARGIDVQCKVELEKDDSSMARVIAVAVGAGLAGHVNEKVRNAIEKVKKEKKHAH